VTGEPVKAYFGNYSNHQVGDWIGVFSVDAADAQVIGRGPTNGAPVSEIDVPIPAGTPNWRL